MAIPASRLTRAGALQRVRAHLTVHAPDLLDHLTVAWGDMSPVRRDCEGWAVLRLTEGARSDRIYIGALMVLDGPWWGRLTDVQRKDLVDHETAHLIADYYYPDELRAHGQRWRRWYKRLASRR